MQPHQNPPLASRPTDESDANERTKVLTLQQQAWIDYNALNGLITDVTEERIDPKTNAPMTLRKMTIQEFADRVGVNRSTLRDWRSNIPNFWQRVNDRRIELAPQSRLQRMHEVWYLSALKTGAEGFRDRQLWLANFDENFRMPTEKVEHEVGGSWAKLIEEKRASAIIEGEVVDNGTEAM